MIWDCFPFNSEFDCLEIRLNELNEVVDRWILVEMNRTQVGVPKPFYFEKWRHRFRRWLPRITHIKVYDCPNFGDPFKRERHQRNAIQRGLRQAQSHDIITIGDADEIPRPEVYEHFWKNLRSHQICSLNMRLHHYYLNGVTQEPWTFPKIMTGALYNTSVPEEIRHWDFLGGVIGESIQDAGWHFSWLGGIGACFKKFNNNQIPVEWGKTAIHDDLSRGILPNPNDGKKSKVTITDGSKDGNFYPKYVAQHLEAFTTRGLIAPLPKPNA